MTKERYDKIAHWFSGRPVSLYILKLLNRWLPRVVYCAYPLFLCILAVRRDEHFWRVLLVPAVVFAIITVMRKCWNFPRPYELLNIHPLIPNSKEGQSFPSRHVASATIIAIAFWYVSPPLGIAMAVITLLIAATRILSGIHFPRDVIAGMILSLLAGVVGFWLIK